VIHERALTPVICHFWGVGNLESIFLVREVDIRGPPLFAEL